MSKRSCLFALAFALLFVGAAHAQYPILDMVAQKVIQKYQQSSCESSCGCRKASRNHSGSRKSYSGCAAIRRWLPPSFNQVAAPIANKMFECGMIP